MRTKLNTIDVANVGHILLHQNVILKVILLIKRLFAYFENTNSVVGSSGGNEFRWIRIITWWRPWDRVNASHVAVWYDSFVFEVWTFDLPNTPFFVFGTRAQEITWSIKINLPYGTQMPIHCEIAEPIVHFLAVFPALYGIVIRCTEQKVFSWVPFDEFHVLGVAWKNWVYAKFKICVDGVAI